MRIEIHLPVEIVKSIGIVAKKEKRSRKAYLEYLIIKHVETIKIKSGIN